MKNKADERNNKSKKAYEWQWNKTCKKSYIKIIIMPNKKVPECRSKIIC
jgi:hypothetical protein